MVKSAQLIAQPTSAVAAPDRLQTQTLPRPAPNAKSFSIVMRTEDLGPDRGPRTQGPEDRGPADLKADRQGESDCKSAAELTMQIAQGSSVLDEWYEKG